MKSVYNERFSYAYPNRAASRTTRYRTKRKKQEEPESPSDSDFGDEEGAGFELDDNDHPLSLEKEILYDERTDSPPDVTESETEDESSSELAESFLYDGSSLTVRTSSVLILKFKMRHNLTDESVSDLLHLIKLHCPAPNRCLSSLYHFKKQFYDMQYPIVVSHFCSCCLNALTPDDIAEQMNCPNPPCESTISSPNSVSSFIEVPIDLQLKSILERK